VIFIVTKRHKDLLWWFINLNMDAKSIIHFKIWFDNNSSSIQRVFSFIVTLGTSSESINLSGGMFKIILSVLVNMFFHNLTNNTNSWVFSNFLVKCCYGNCVKSTFMSFTFIRTFIFFIVFFRNLVMHLHNISIL
jgi:hypothetical protein